MVATRGQIIDAWNLTLWGSSNFHYSLAMAMLIFAAHWLYWRLTGLRYSRSLGQRMFGIAVLAEDGSAMTSQMWDQRAWRKLVFLIPILNIIQGVRELARISQRHTHQSNIDLHVGSIVAHADSLPPANRKHIKWGGPKFGWKLWNYQFWGSIYCCRRGLNRLPYLDTTCSRLPANKYCLGWFVCNQKQTSAYAC